MTVAAQQGHRYLWCGVDEVLALESGMGYVTVTVLEHGSGLWIGPKHRVHVADLTPLPMRYFGDRVP